MRLLGSTPLSYAPQGGHTDIAIIKYVSKVLALHGTVCTDKSARTFETYFVNREQRNCIEDPTKMLSSASFLTFLSQDKYNTVLVLAREKTT